MPPLVPRWNPWNLIQSTQLDLPVFTTRPPSLARLKQVGPTRIILSLDVITTGLFFLLPKKCYVPSLQIFPVFKHELPNEQKTIYI